MKVYLVGGAIRDGIAGMFIQERDWVCTGTVEKKLNRSYFKSVGKDFPVFLNPETHEEYALARIEKKTGMGYKNFFFLTESAVTLLEDLNRRDLTINSIARSENGILIDPYSGAKDLRKKVLRHITHSFAEAPVRILRIARLGSKYTDFNISNKTNQLMRDMVLKKEIDYLSSDRIWKEYIKAVSENDPIKFFQIIKNCSALFSIFPNMSFSDKVLKNFTRAISTIKSTQVRFSVLMSHNSMCTLSQYSNHYSIPKKFISLSVILCKYINLYSRIDYKNLNPDLLIRILTLSDALRRPDRFSYFLIAAIFCITDDAHNSRIKIIKSIMNYAKILRFIRKKNEAKMEDSHVIKVKNLKKIFINCVRYHLEKKI